MGLRQTVQNTRYSPRLDVPERYVVGVCSGLDISSPTIKPSPIDKENQPCTVSKPPASRPRWFHHRKPLKNDRALQPRAPCSPRRSALEPRRPRRRGGQDVGDMRVGRADPGASDLNSHPAGKPWNPRDRGHRGAAAALRLEKRQPQQLGGMGSPAHLFSWQQTPAINANALQNSAGSAERISRQCSTQNSQVHNRMNGTLMLFGRRRAEIVAAVRPLVGASRQRQKRESDQCRAVTVVLRGCNKAPEIR